MADMLIRDVPRTTLQRLKARAKRHGRSLQGEARQILEQAAQSGDVHAIVDRWKKRLVGRQFDGSAALIRGDRSR